MRHSGSRAAGSKTSSRASPTLSGPWIATGALRHRRRALARVRKARSQELTREEVLGQNVWGRFPVLEGSVIYDKYHEALGEQKTVHFEASQPSGGWVEVHVYPIQGGLSVYSQDITERKRVEERLSYHAHLLENIHDAVIATDEQVVLTAWNKGAEQIYGWTAGEVLGRKVWEVVPTDLTDEQRAEAGRNWPKRVAGTPSDDVPQGRHARPRRGALPSPCEGSTARSAATSASTVTSPSASGRRRRSEYRTGGSMHPGRHHRRVLRRGPRVALHLYQ